jgi:hypothetical protein
LNHPGIHLSRLFVHPVKGAAPIEVTSWEVDELGLRDDRRWMIVSGDGVFLTQRTLPRMATIHVRFEGDGLAFSAPGVSDLEIPGPIARPASGEERLVTVWRDAVRARAVEGGASAWLTRVLGVPCALFWMPHEAEPARLLRQETVAGLGHDRPVSFADAFPFLLVSSEAVGALNDRIAAKPDGEKPVIIAQRFRPNIVVTGAGAHAEDAWHRIRIGELRFLVARPCARCAVPAVDPETGVRGTEPTRTLATYRRHDGQVWFGQNLVHESTGPIAVGASVTVEQRTPLNPPV